MFPDRLVLIFISFLISVCLYSQEEPLGLVIEDMTQELEFFIAKDEKLKARLTVTEVISSESSLKKKYIKAIFFDEHSEVEKLEKRHGKRSKTRLKKNISDYESDGIFHSDLKVCYFSHTFKNVGEVYTLQYSKVFHDLKFLTKLFFSEQYKVKKSTITIKVPDWLDLNIVEWNMEQGQVEKNTIPQKESAFHTYSINTVEERRRYKNEPGTAHHLPHLIPIVRSYSQDGKKTTLMSKTADMYNWYAGLVKKIGNETIELEALVEEITKGVETDLDKIKRIYYWVQDNIRYLAYEQGIMGFKPEACQAVLSNRYGDCKGMANLTKEMLVAAGFDARLTWLGTNDLPYDYSIPSLTVDNHMICTVMYAGRMLFLDATEKHTDLDFYAYRIEGKQVLVEDGKEFLLKNIPITELESNKESYKNSFSIKEDRLVGSGELEMKGNRKSWLYSRLYSTSTKDRKEALERYINNGSKNIDLELTSKEVELIRDQAFKATYNIAIDNQLVRIANEIYVNAEFDYTLSGRSLPKERSRSYTLHERYFINSESLIEIPESYKNYYLPDPVNVVDDKYEIQLSYKEEGNNILYIKSIKIKNPVLEVSDFKKWNETIEQLKTFYEDQIILQKQK